MHDLGLETVIFEIESKLVVERINQGITDCTEYGILIQASRFGLHDVSWQRPREDDVVVLNANGRSLSYPGMEGFWGLIRNHLGEFIMGYFGTIGASTILHAEIMALLYGLKLCWELGYRKIHCYSDSLHTIQLV